MIQLFPIGLIRCLCYPNVGGRRIHEEYLAQNGITITLLAPLTFQFKLLALPIIPLAVP